MHSWGDTVTGERKLVSNYSLGIKDSGEPLDLTAFYGKGLAFSRSDKYSKPKDTTSESYSPMYYGYVFKADDTMDNYLNYSKDFTGNFYPSGGSTQGDNDIWKVDKGWIVRPYRWTLTDKKIEAKACRSLSDCSRKYYRHFQILRTSANRLYYVLSGYQDMDAGDTDKAIADLEYLTNYNGFLEVFDYQDIDGDGKENKDDAYPYDPLAQ